MLTQWGGGTRGVGQTHLEKSVQTGPAGRGTIPSRDDWEAWGLQVCTCGLCVKSHCWVPALVLPLISCISSGEFLDLFNLSVPQFPHL